MRRAAGEFRSALAGGRFLSAWSLAASLPLSLTLVAPIPPGGSPARALGATLATWACVALALSATAAGERAARSGPVRAAIVIAGVLVCAVLRPSVQDAWARTIGLPTLPSGQLPLRIATNVVVWVVALTALALLHGTLRSLRETNARLRLVASDLELSRERARAYETEAEEAVRAACAGLVVAIDRLGPPGTPDAVRSLTAPQFREWSHRLRDLADRAAANVPCDRTDVSPPRLRRVPFRVPPAGVVPALYIACLLPYALRTTAPVAVLVGLGAVMLGGLLVDAAARRRAAVRQERNLRIFIGGSAIVGVGLSALAVQQGTALPLAALSAVAYSGCAVGAGMCAGALKALRSEQRRLSSAITTAQRTSHEDTRDVRAGLRRAAELLHRDGQGECVHFLLAFPAPSADDLAGLQRRLREVVAVVPAAFAGDAGRSAAEAEDALHALVALWGRVMDLRFEVPDAARTALRSSPGAAEDAYAVVAEGLLNAVKHAAERRAEVLLDVVATGAGSRLRVRVVSHGEATGARLRPGSNVRSLGARLLAGPDGAVLEAAFPLGRPVAVVSPEHPS